MLAGEDGVGHLLEVGLLGWLPHLASLVALEFEGAKVDEVLRFHLSFFPVFVRRHSSALRGVVRGALSLGRGVVPTHRAGLVVSQIV